VRIPETKYKRSNSVFLVTFVALICGRMWLQLLQSLAQSLIGSPGTLGSLTSILKMVSPLNSHTGSPKRNSWSYVSHMSLTTDALNLHNTHTHAHAT